MNAPVLWSAGTVLFSCSGTVNRGKEGAVRLASNAKNTERLLSQHRQRDTFIQSHLAAEE